MCDPLNINILKSLFISRKILYLPIEIHSREIHSRLFLAHAAVADGWDVVIGPRFELSALLEFLPSGVYLGIGFHTSAVKIAQKLKSVGHLIVSLDEEGMVRLAPKYYREYRVDQKIFAFSEKVICWSTGHLNEIKQLATDSEKLTVLGNPRLDILSAEARPMFFEEVEKIKETHGDFILINSSFGTANHLHGIDYWRGELEKRGWFDTADKAHYQNLRIKFQIKIFHAMRDLAIAIAEKKLQLVIRPHPSECLKTWRELEQAYPSIITVVREGNVIPWMLASKVVIHNGCTTAIEGRLLDKPVISYCPTSEPLVESELANSVGLLFSDKDKLVKFLYERLKFTELTWPELPELNNNEIIKSTAEENFAFKFLRQIKSPSNYSTKLDSFGIYKHIVLVLWRRFKLFISGIKNREGRAYEEQKCCRVTKQETEYVLEQLNNNSIAKASTSVFTLTKRSILIRNNKRNL